MRKRRMLALAGAAAVLAVVAGSAIAGHMTSGVKSYTGCLTPGEGVLIKIKEGNVPASPCSGGQVEVHLSGGDITAISAQTGGGLSGGGDNGAVSLSIRRDCGSGQVVKWDGGAWACADDSNATYTAGTGLDLSSGGEFSVEESYRLPQTCASGEAATRNPALGGGAATWTCSQYATAGQSCTSGQFAKEITALGALSCAAPPTGGGSQAYTAIVGAMSLGGTQTVISKALPAGKYLLYATVDLVNKDNDSPSTALCNLPSGSGSDRATQTTIPGDVIAYGSLSVTSAVTHAGGNVVLACQEVDADVDIGSASLIAHKVDSIG